MKTKQIQKNTESLETTKKLDRTYPANTTVLSLENHFGQGGYECAVHGCRDIWFFGDGDVRDFNHVGTVCATHGYLIPRMSLEEIKDLEIGCQDYHYWTYHDSRYETDMFPTRVYTPNGELKEFISTEGQKQKDELEEFLRSRQK